ncbi:mitochondrial inner membrane magnesium transporter MIT1-like [Clytia hemisphaerica]|uniref:mitochondrial inner membrane magnesium transporter MIT1-like n=1 Tax=Clytia hemisphaerica TaxID=252671 RepID=UPI0034D5F1ED
MADVVTSEMKQQNENIETLVKNVQHLDDFKVLNHEQKLNVLFIKLNRQESLFQDLKALQNDVNNLQESVKLLDTNVEGLAYQFNDLQKEVDSHDGRVKSNKTQINTLLNKDTEHDQKIMSNKSEINKLQNALKTIRQEVNDQEQYTRRTMCVVQGIPYKKEEDTDKIIGDIITKLDVPIQSSDIDISHRQRIGEKSWHHCQIC